MARTKANQVNKPSISFRKMLEMEPEALRQLDADYFQYARAKDIAKLSDEQLFALHPDQVKYLKPISFSEVEPDKLRALLARLEEQVPKEEDIWIEEVPGKDKDGNDAILEKERYGAQETIRRAIIKAEKFFKDKEKVEKLRQQDGEVEGFPGRMYADVVWAKLDITMRYLYMLAAEQGQIDMSRPGSRHMVLTQSVVDYLNRQRRAGARLDESGKPIHLDEHGRPCHLSKGEWVTLDGNFPTKPAYEEDETGKLRPVLDRVELEPLTEVPTLYPVEEFADRLRMDSRSFIRNCNDGFYDHIRIGSVLKMSEDDFYRSMERIEKATMIRGVGRKPKALNA